MLRVVVLIAPKRTVVVAELITRVPPWIEVDMSLFVSVTESTVLDACRILIKLPNTHTPYLSY